MHTVHIKPNGIIDAEEGQSLLEQIQSGIEQGKLFFYFDFSSVYVVDVQGLEKFLQGLKAIFDGGGDHKIFSLNHAVQIFFASKGLDFALNITP